jgi:hypothetical protein
MIYPSVDKKSVIRNGLRRTGKIRPRMWMRIKWMRRIWRLMRIWKAMRS